MIVAILLGIVFCLMSLAKKDNLRAKTQKMLYDFTLNDETPTLTQLVKFSQKHPVQYELTDFNNEGYFKFNSTK